MERVMNLTEVSQMTGYSPATLRKWKCQQRAGRDTGHAPLRFVKMGTRKKQARVGVLEADLAAWMQAETLKSDPLEAR